MQIAPYLIFDGRCAEAFRFYEQTLGGKIEGMMTFGESPAAGDVPPALRDRVIHVRMTVGDQVLMGSDSPPERYEKPQGTFISLQIDDLAKAERVFGALAENGQVRMPFEKTFWAQRFGMLVDRFGTLWMVNCGSAGTSA